MKPTPKPTPYTDAFLQKLKEDMSHLKLRQYELANHLEIAPQYVSQWFTRRKRSMSSESLLKIQGWIKSKTLFFL